MKGANFAAKHADGRYWCGRLGWVRCRFCAIKMGRRRAHRIAHAHGGRVVRVVKPQSHAIARAEAEVLIAVVLLVPTAAVAGSVFASCSARLRKEEDRVKSEGECFFKCQPEP